MFGFLKRLFGSSLSRTLNRYRKIVKEVNEWDEKFQALSDEGLRGKSDEFRERLSQGESIDAILPEAYAVVKGTCRRLCGSEIHVSGYDQEWDMVPYDVQILGAISMHYGAVVEMQTGEGKTLTATMPLYLNALTGNPVHLVTVNDYLAERDCQWMGTVFRWLGLDVGALTNATPPQDRKEIYKKDIVYGTSSEFGFDYLRDNSTASNAEEQVQRGYYFAIVDEIDSILIDEARTPLIISGPVPVSRQMYDSLQGSVSTVVYRQKELCNRLATEARKILDHHSLLDREGLENEIEIKDEKEKKKIEEAFRKLWLVSKGMPRHKVLKKALEHPDARAAIDKWDLFYHSDQNKEEKSAALAELFITIDERSSDYELTDKGIAAWDKSAGEMGNHNDFVMLDLGHEYALIEEDKALSDSQKAEKKRTLHEADLMRKERAHNLRQLFRAHLLMENDVDYIVQDGKVIIIDENTGRAQPGRRFSDGLHQAIEAKENVPIQKETQTYASITLQNYFRMYSKLAGMTGTAMTEAHEFKEIYGLDVLEIPTNVPCLRKDANDLIFMTEREKYNAIIKEIMEVNCKNRPVLVGTESVDVSEKLSRILKQKGLKHSVLNAKQHADEAEIIAQAGRAGAITIATNMAGRGTDIKLQKGVAECGGLHVIGTTRHQSRRIDRQLRGRCARLGDPGTSQFYVSFEDSLMRLFASQRMSKILKRMRLPEGEAVSASMLNRSVESAQKRIEQRNFMIRKHTLEYDDVMNKQRQEIYSFRNEILHSENLIAIAEDIIDHATEIMAEKFFRSRSEEGGWNPEGFRQHLIQHFPIGVKEGFFDNDHMDIEEIVKLTSSKLIEAFRAKMASETDKAKHFAESISDDANYIVSSAIRSLIVRKIDQMWQEHLLVMDNLRSEVRLRTIGQKDPLLEFKHEAFELFFELSSTLRTELAENMFRLEILLPDIGWLQSVRDKVQLETDRSFAEDLEEEKERPTSRPIAAQPIVVEPKVGRNDPCPCGSGKKYKKCCGIKELV